MIQAFKITSIKQKNIFGNVGYYRINEKILYLLAEQSNVKINCIDQRSDFNWIIYVKGNNEENFHIFLTNFTTYYDKTYKIEKW